jgi:hypothetical protein
VRGHSVQVLAVLLGLWPIRVAADPSSSSAPASAPTSIPATQPALNGTRRIPAPKLVFSKLSPKAQRAVRSAIGLSNLAAAVDGVIPGARTPVLELRWRGSTLYVVYHITVASSIRAKLQGDGFLDGELLSSLAQRLSVFGGDIAHSLGATQGQYGAGPNPGVLERIRFVGKRSAVEVEVDCHESGSCVPPNSLECHQPGKKPVIAYPDLTDAFDGIIRIAAPVDLGGKLTGTRCFHDLWR